MTPEIALVLILLVVVVILLAKEFLPVEQVSLLLVAILAASGILPADVAFQGFASETVVMLACIMVLSRRLAESGLIVRLTARVRQSADLRPQNALGWLMTVSACLSSVVTNTSTTAVLIPAVSETARRLGVSPRRFLMPVAFASMMGGSTTLIGTSTNLAASGAVSRLGMAPFGVFEFAVVGIVVSISGIALMMLLGPWLLPGELEDPEESPATSKEFMATLVVPEGSRSIGMAVSDLDFDAHALTAMAVSREGGRVAAHPRRKLREADRIIVRGARSALIGALGDPQLGLVLKMPAPKDEPAQPILIEAVLMPGARWTGQTLNAARAEFGSDLRILGLHRRGQKTAALIGRMRLKSGDILLMSGPRDCIEALGRDPDLSLLMPPEPGPPSAQEGKYTLFALLLAIAVGTSGILPFSVALLIAVLALVLTGRFSLQDMFGMISWRILILIGGMSSFGVAMQTSGAAFWLAGNVVSALGGFGPLALLLGLGVLTILLTQPMSNAVAALTVLPVAIGVADQLGADPRPFAVMVTLSASLSFIAPFEPALLLVYGPGQYSFRNFLRAGIPLTFVSLFVLLVLIPVLWPLGIAAF